MLQQYIDGGSYFLAAKVAADAGIESGDKLSPLQFAYTSDAFQIPIRIGTLNAKEAQDLVVYAVSDYQNGRVGISNSVYREFSIEDECMWDPVDNQSFGDYYAEQFTKGYEETEDGAWTVEYAWGGGGCDPCSGTPPDASDLISLGVNEDLVYYSDYFFTRLHARYTPAQATEELMLYQSNLTDQMQYRYIEYKYELEDRFPVCGQGMVDNPGSCDVDNSNEPSSEGPSTPDGYTATDASNTGCGGCSSGETLAFGVWLMGLFGVRRRSNRSSLRRFMSDFETHKNHVITHALVITVLPFSPIPLLDWLLEPIVARRMIAPFMKYPDQRRHFIGKGGSFCLGCITSLLLYPLTKLFKILRFFLNF